MVKSFLISLSLLFILNGCASRMKDQMKAYRDAYALGDYSQAQKLLNSSDLKKDKKSLLLWHLESGTVSLAQENYDQAVSHFQQSLELIDLLFTVRLSSKAASLLINDASDEFYGASYERSYAHYFLARALYQRYLLSGNKLDLQGARGTILAWDSYFSELQRSATSKTVYHTDLMLKVFGAQVHEVSEIRNDKQIALQLYKDALEILKVQGGIFFVFNKNNVEYIKAYEAAIQKGKAPSPKLYHQTSAYEDLEDFLHLKILAMTKEVRGFDFSNQVSALKAKPEIVKRASDKKANIVLIFEEGLIPAKVGKPFNFGIKGALGAVDNKGAKAFIATVGVEALTLFAMNKLGMVPTERTNPGSFMFAHNVTKLAVQEAAVEFELPMIEKTDVIQRLELFVLNDKGVIIKKLPLPIISENGDIARVVLEEDVVARYTKTGTRVAVRHLMAIVTAMGIYQKLKQGDGDFLAKSAALATYLGASKGIAALEKADTRHWTTLPQVIRMTELSLAPGSYKIGLASYSQNNAPESPTKILGDVVVKESDKSLHTFRFSFPH